MGGASSFNPVKAVENLVKNPLPTIATVGLNAAGVPAPITAAMVNYAQGGDIGSAIKAGVGSYIGGQVAGQIVPQTGLVGTAAEAAKGAISGGISAGVSGGNPLAGVLMGAAGGAAREAVSGFFGEGEAPEEGAGAEPSEEDFLPPELAELSPEERAARLPELYPGGRLPEAGEVTVYSTTGEPYYSREMGTTERLARSGAEKLARMGTGGLFAPSVGTTTTAEFAAPRVPSPGTAALAQALRTTPDMGGGDTIFGGEGGGQRRKVWNIASLREKDETGS